MGIVSGTARTSCNSLFYPAFCSCKDFSTPFMWAYSRSHKDDMRPYTTAS